VGGAPAVFQASLPTKRVHWRRRFARVIAALVATAIVIAPLAAEADPAPPAAPADPVPPAAAHAPAAGPVAEPQGYKLKDFRSPVPLTLKGAKALTGDQAADLWNANGAIFIDVYPQAPKPKNLPAGTFWRDPAHRTMEGAHWLPNVGYGALPDAIEAYFHAGLERLTKGNRAAPIVLFCLKDCWMSWNAAKRAVAAGYTNVMWFRDGTDAWQELGYPLVDVAKEPEADNRPDPTKKPEPTAP
jgi:PQQ-dependent catabolism-associated CXXCW motif protein